MVKVKIIKSNAEGETLTTEPVFHNTAFTATAEFEIVTQIAESYQTLHNGFQECQWEGSGWSQETIILMAVNEVPYSPLAGSPSP